MKKVLLTAMLLATATGAVAKPIKSLKCEMYALGTIGLSYLPGSKCNPS